MVKQEVLKMIQSLPDDVSLEQIATELESIRFKARVEEGLNALDRGDWVSHDEARERLRKWRTK